MGGLLLAGALAVTGGCSRSAVAPKSVNGWNRGEFKRTAESFFEGLALPSAGVACVLNATWEKGLKNQAAAAEFLAALERGEEPDLHDGDPLADPAEDIGELADGCLEIGDLVRLLGVNPNHPARARCVEYLSSNEAARKAGWILVLAGGVSESWPDEEARSMCSHD